MASDDGLTIKLSNNTSTASVFLQARVSGFDRDEDTDGDDIDYFAHSSTIRLIDENTPTGDATEDELHFTDIKPQMNATDSADANKKTADESALQLIESQKNMIDRLNQQLKDRKLTLTNTINNHEIEMNELRIEIEKLCDENKQITELQAANIKLKYELSKYDKLKNAKMGKRLPPKPTKTKSIDRSPSLKTQAPAILKSKSVATGASSIASSLALKFSKKPGIAAKIKSTKTNPKLKKYETMKKIGMPFQSIINKMRMDQCSDALIAEFKGETIEDDEGSNIDLSADKFSKYKKLKKIAMPSASIINRMRMDGLSKDEIDAFEHQILEGNTPSKRKAKKIDKKEQMRQLAVEMGLKPKIEVKPKRVKKLKRIHWKVIELKDIKGTIWERFGKKHTDQEIGIGAKFELQFQIRQKKPKQATLRRTRVAGLPNFGRHPMNNEQKERKSKKKKIQWLDAKRDQMIQIGLKKVGLSNDTIYDAVMDMDDSVMSVDVMETFYELLPSKEEQAKTEEKIDQIMNENKDNEDEDPLLACGPAEMFFVEISAVPEVKEQVAKWLFCRTFKEIWSHRMQQATLMMRAGQAIKTSTSLKEYLRILLAIGNLMNHGTDKCMAYGFNLDCLSMLEGIKDFSGKKSLAMFVYEFAYNKHPLTHNIDKQLAVLNKAVRLETNAIERSVKAMNEEFDAIDVLCRRLADDYNEPDTAAFREYMEKFFAKNKSNMAILKTKLKNAKTLSRSVDKYYGYDDLAEDDKPEQLFQIIQSFLDTMNKAKDALFKLEKERMKLQKQRQKEREKWKKQKAKQKGPMGANRAPPSRPPSKRAAVKPRLVLTVTSDNDEDMKLAEGTDEEDAELENSPLRNHFRKKTQNLAQQHLDLGNRLATTLKEKQAIAHGKLTQSFQNNHIKKRSIMSGSEQYPVFGNSTMKEIAELAVQDAT
eukprot:26450_1